MTPSPNRSIRPRPASRPARRTRLLAASALAGSVLGGVAAMLAPPALAGTLPGIPSAANITVSSGGSQPTITFPDAITLQIDLNAPRTVINWADLHLSSGDAMNFLFDAASDIVLNKTTSQIQFDSGSVVTGKIGAATGGNVWFYSPQGVIVSPGATMTAGGFVFSSGSALNDLSFVGAADPLANLRAATDALIQMTTVSIATSASINSSGDVVLSASSGALNVAIAEGATVDISTTSGSITASQVIAASGEATVAAGGPGATVTSITGATGVTVSSGANTSVGSATTTTSGDILLSTSAGSASLTLGNSARDLTLSADQVFTSTIDAARDVFVTGASGATVTNRIFAGDDIEITASNGNVAAGGAFLRSTGAGASDDAHILLRSDTGSVTASNTLQTQGTGVQAGDITVQAATTASVGTATASRDIRVSGVTTSLNTGSAARDIFVTATTGGATVVNGATAGDDVEVTATSGAVSAAGATLRSTGVGAADDGHVLARSTGGAVNVGSAVTEGTGATAGSVTISAATAATLAVGDASLGLTVTGASASLTSGSAARDLQVTATTGDATVVSSATAADDVEVTTVDGDVLASGATLTSTGLSTGASDGHVWITSTNGSIDFGTAITQGVGASAGNVVVDAGGTITGASAQATQDVSVTAAGGVDLAWAKAARDITVSSTGSAATLGGAELTGSGAGHDLLVLGSNNATLGAPDFSSIGAGNRFSRTGGNTGTATVRSTTGDAKVYLDAGDAIDTVEGENVDVTINNGPATFGALTARTGNLYVEVLDGSLTIGAATATSGNLELYALGGDLTLTGSAQGDGLVHLETDGLLDASSASLISSNGDVELLGADVDVNQVTADGAIVVVAATGDALVQLAQAGQTVQVLSLNGDATLRAAEGPAGVTVAALNTATFGADDKASITAANYVVTDPSCGCGTDGLQVVSSAGDAVVNINSASNGVALVAAAGGGAVVQKTGDLKIEVLEAYNIWLEAMDGTLETGSITSTGGDYSVTAQDFLGDVLTPTLSSGVIGDITIADTLGDLNLGAAALHVDGELTLVSSGSVTGSGAIETDLLNVTAGTGVALTGANHVARLGTVNVAAGGFVFQTAGAFELTGPVNAVGQTVDLRAGGAITQRATGVITAQRLTGSSVGGANFGAANQLAQLGGFTNTGGGQLKLANARALSIDGTVASTGTVSLASHGGMTITGLGRVQAGGAGDAAVLASDGVFTNARGADAVTTANGRWLIYTQAAGAPLGSTAGDSFNGLVGKTFYGSAYDFAAGTFATAPKAGNRFVHAYQPILTVAVTPASQAILFGQTPTITTTITGVLAGDLAADAWSGAPAISGANNTTPGTHALTASLGSLVSDLNYGFTYVPGTLTIAFPPSAGDVPPGLKLLSPTLAFSLDRSSDAGLTVEEEACAGEDCSPQAAVSGGGKTVAALR